MHPNDKSTSKDSGDIESEDTFEQLRHLLIAPEQEKLEKLGERLDDPQLHARDVSQILPMAISLSTQKDDRLTDALAPALSKSIMVLIKKDVHAFANALFPVLGPAIRRSISETFKQMLQGLNQTLENSFSINGIKWRFEAWRTGKQFSEIVLLHSLVYRVEQVFLIHRETGLLLLHAGEADGVFQDSDLVSGMLTAIQDFVRDSFDVSSEQSLDAIQMEDFTVWIEQGPEAVIAAAIRGNAPQSVRVEMKTALENIHLELGDELANFEGDPSLFESAKIHLDNCLQQRFQEKTKKTSPLLWIFGMAIFALLLIWTWVSVRDHRHWQNYLDQLNNKHGIVVTEVIKQGDVYHIYGLRDPLAEHPSDILAKSMLSTDTVVHHFQPYQALTQEFILQRARDILMPSSNVDLSFNDGVLKLVGVASHDWIQSTRGIGRLIPGVAHIDDEDLNIKIDLSTLDAPKSVSLTLDGTNIIAKGSAPHNWILSSREKVYLIPGVTGYNDSEVTDADYERMNSIKKSLEQEIILFRIDSSALEQDMSVVVNDVQNLISSANILGEYAIVHIIGHSDSSGGEHHNMVLSQDRANSVYDYLIAHGIPQKHLVAVGVGLSQPVTQETTEEKSQLNRSVTFTVELNNKVKFQ
ncbi:MAG: OmpA family protein [Gammaproteobacteria bacterium]|nr:MAG: OmpA family protein [Gammaproteobacteria bacterium]